MKAVSRRADRIAKAIASGKGGSSEIAEKALELSDKVDGTEAMLHPKRRRIASIVFIVGIIGGLFFLSSNITGNAIGSGAISNWIGVVLLIVGLVAGFFWFRGRKR